MIINFALSVDNTELSRHFVVVRLAMRVVVDPTYSNLSSPTVSHTLFFFLRVERRDEATVGYFAAFGDFGGVHEEDCVVAVNPVSYTLCQATNIVGQIPDPCCLVGSC